MKTAVTVLLTLALTAAKPISEEKKEAAIAIHEECVKTTGIEAEDIIKAMEKGIAEDPKIKEHMFCFQKALGIIDDDGTIQKDLLTEKLADFIEDEDRAKEIVEKCYDQKDDKLETAYAMGICMHHEIHSE